MHPRALYVVTESDAFMIIWRGRQQQPDWKRTESIRMRRGSSLFRSEKCDEVGPDFTYSQSSVI